MPVIPATWEVGIWRVMVGGHPRLKVRDIPKVRDFSSQQINCAWWFIL
jgi:hypothetical protein